MSVMLETKLGDIVIDLLVDESPKACENFLKLCKVKYYNYSPVHTVQKGFTLQTGDPLGPSAPDSDGGSSIWGLLGGPKTFPIELPPRLKHTERGTVSMATVAPKHNPDQKLAASQFIITLAENQDYLDGKAAIFGQVAEGFDVLEKINDAFVDEQSRPLRDIRIRHTIVLDDPFPDPVGLVVPPESPVPSKAQLATVRIADDEELDDNVDEEAMDKLRREREARAQALTLEMLGDLPFAEVKPPENVLFVCKLNPVTQDDDLQLIFSRFGVILSCEVIRDKRTGDSLQYAFIEFEDKEACEQAYFKMQGVLIDDHRIHVDFSQSVSKLEKSWRNATASKRRQRGGFGGVADLEQKRQYRNTEDVPKHDDSYGMVFNKDRKDASDNKASGGSTNRSGRDDRNRDRSPRRRERSQDHYYRRSRSRSPRRDSRRGRDRHYDDDRNSRRDRDWRHDDHRDSRRDRDRLRDDHRDSRRDRHRDEDRDYRRERRR
ncbi:RNA binding protein [Penicillium argentinense]|uniref:Peptidyl-prolyl cis-trans isomerase n=1 Tax=Penicillium argentinense TaxID=1131581 RepID=A0A9W9G0J9_9EURO|nr:RNA binding protein [Penicillium argentinense]KAJ5109743.1 RNA binding protein [Penicillium argentinense]